MREIVKKARDWPLIVWKFKKYFITFSLEISSKVQDDGKTSFI